MHKCVMRTLRHIVTKCSIQRQVFVGVVGDDEAGVNGGNGIRYTTRQGEGGRDSRAASAEGGVNQSINHSINQSIKTCDAQASLGYPDRRFRYDSRPSTPEGGGDLVKVDNGYGQE